MSSRFLAQQRQGFFALFVLVCALLTIYLRLDFYPDTYYADEEIPIAVVAHMEKNHSLDTNWARGIWRKTEDRWAYGYDQYNFSSYNSTQYYLNQIFQVSENHINSAIFNRICSLAFQIISLFIICYTINSLVGSYGAIAAGLFFAANPLLVVDAHYARPESFLIFITTISVFFHLVAIPGEKPGYFFASAFMWGIACACKFSILPMAGLCCLHFYIQKPNQNKRIPELLIWLSCFFIGAFLLAPYTFINADKVMHGVIALFKQYFNAQSPDAVVFERTDMLLPKYLLGYFGAAFWLAIILSPLHPDKNLKWLSICLLLIVFFYITLFSLLTFFNESNLSHLAVVWCLLLAISIEACIAHARTKTKHIHVFFVTISLAVFATPVLCSYKIKHNVYDQEAKNKIQHRIEANEKMLLDTHPDARIIDISTQPSLLNQPINEAIIIKLPWMERHELYSFTKILTDQKYILLAEIKLPLNELPHSQLQSIHFPASYRYYQRTQSNTGE